MVVDAVTGDSVQLRCDTAHRPQQADRRGEGRADPVAVALVGQLEAALARIAELEARLAKLDRPAKTPDNSSLPPSRGQKGVSGISCGVGHDRSKGARPCRDAKSLVYLTPSSTSCWPGPIPKRPSIPMG